MIRELRLDGRCGESVLLAMEKLDRREFLPPDKKAVPIEMRPISIGYGQTMSAPFIVGSMSTLLDVRSGSKILEIGTGCGYQTAVLLELGAQVYSIEYIPELTEMARSTLAQLGFSNYEIRCSDGFYGWTDNAPYDGIISAASAPYIPPNWITQLKEGGVVVAPLEKDGREFMVRAVKRGDKLEYNWLYGVRFVPFVGAIRDQE